MNENNFKIMMLAICGISLALVIGWIFTPTDFTISLDENAVEISKNLVDVSSKLYLLQQMNDSCKTPYTIVDYYEKQDVTTIEVDLTKCDRMLRGETFSDVFLCYDKNDKKVQWG